MYLVKDLFGDLTTKIIMFVYTIQVYVYICIDIACEQNKLY